MNLSVPFGSLAGSYADGSPILLVATSGHAESRASSAIEASGHRWSAVGLEQAVDRLSCQVAASGIWVEVDDCNRRQLSQLLDRLEARVKAADFPAAVSAPLDLIDTLEGRLHDAGIELLADAGPSDRAIALARMASWSTAKNGSVNDDVSRDNSEAHLRQLSDEISRIAATLARLSTGPGPSPVEKPEPAAGDAPPVSAEMVRQVIRSRRMRARYFDEELFADPAWDMMLDLLQAEIAQHRVPVSSLCIAAAVPATTALRWIKSMTESGLFQRRADPHDGRRVFVELAPHASEALRQYFRDVGRVAVV